ncbi:hypothetical protein ACVCNH_23060 [Achromobacter anxifer]|uniref:hypothetical protein n=1 Tax=Achromobacter aegrifaciens TaxID=1287736 RepID=UPI0006C89830|nr:hypothetical protein [Achromobacter aegrifaciens]
MPNQEFLEALLDILALILNVLDSNGDLKDLPNLPDHRGGLGEQAGAATSPAQKLLSNVKR